MAKKKKETVVEETTKEKVMEETPVEKKEKETPKIDLEKFDSKDDETVVKVDLSKPVEEKNEKEEVTKVNLKKDNSENKEDSVIEEVVEENKEEEPKEDTPIIEEVTEENTAEKHAEKVAEVVEEEVNKSIEENVALPDSIQKLLTFMEETGGNLYDYVKLNQDFSEMDNDTLLREYYKQTKPHLSEDEVEFVMEDKFSFDEESDDERDVKRKKLALKEQVAQARHHLESVKSKYYEDIKSGLRLPEEAQKALDFFNRYNEESKKSNEVLEDQAKVFKTKTDNVFNDKFKGFEYNVGDKRFRFNIKNTSEVRETQGDINNFIGKFLNKDMKMEDAEGYHKSLYTAMNADAIANHFYEQGKADAIKESIAKSKNIDMTPRQSYGENVNTSGLKVRSLDDGPDFKFQIKNKK